MKGLIGNTPLIKIKYKYNGKENYIYTKLEYYNFSGRQKLNSFAEPKTHDYDKIFADIYDKYDKICKQQAELISIARQRYNFEKNIEKVLKEI